MLLSERIRQLAHSKDTYVESLEGEEPDEQMLLTFSEIDGNMTYTGMDDAISELAFEVQTLEESAIVLSPETIRPQPGDAIVVKLPKATHPSVFDSVREFLAAKFPNNHIIVSHEDAELAVVPRSEFAEE